MFFFIPKIVEEEKKKTQDPVSAAENQVECAEKFLDGNSIDPAELSLPGKSDTPGWVAMKCLEKEKKSRGFSGIRTEKNRKKFSKWVEKCLQYAGKLCIIVKLSV